MSGLYRCPDVAIGHDRHRDGGFDLSYDLVIDTATVHGSPGTTVNGQGIDSGAFQAFGHFERIDVLRVPSDANLDRERFLNGGFKRLAQSQRLYRDPLRVTLLRNP
jgi:hypothetical protein